MAERPAAGHLLFKVCSTFDSTEAGNIGPVTDALREDAGEAIALVTPAFPETARTVYLGHLFVGAVPLAESPLKDHPLNPMRDSNLVRVLARQSRAGVGLIDLATVAREQAVGARLDALARDGKGAAIADAVLDRDLAVLGAAGADPQGFDRRSGLGRAGPRARGGGPGRSRRGGGRSRRPDRRPGGLPGRSCSQATLGQIARAEAAMPVRRLDPARLLAGEDEAGAALAWAMERIGRGPVLIASSAGPEDVAAVQAQHGRDAAGHAIEAAMARIAEGLVAQGVRRLVVRAARPPAPWSTASGCPPSASAPRSPPACRSCAPPTGTCGWHSSRAIRRAGLLRRCAAADAVKVGPARPRSCRSGLPSLRAMTLESMKELVGPVGLEPTTRPL